MEETNPKDEAKKFTVLDSRPLKYLKYITSINFPQLAPFFMFQKNFVALFWAPIDQNIIINTYLGAFAYFDCKKFQFMRTLRKQIANFRKKVTLFRPKKHQNNNASEAWDFLDNCLQMSIYLMEPLKSKKTKIWFSRGSKKDTNSVCRKQKKTHAKFNVFSHHSLYPWFPLPYSRNITITKRKQVLKNWPTNSLSWNPHYSNV